MIYLDNAATTFPKPKSVYEKVDYVQKSLAVNVGRGGYKAASDAMILVDETRSMLASLVGAAGPESIIITPSATIAANEIILGLEWNAFKNVYCTPFEHNAIARPIYHKCNELGIKLRQIPFDRASHALDERELMRLFSIDPPDYVFLNHVSNVTGTVIPIDRIAEISKSYGAIVVVDGAQSIGTIPLDLSNSCIDFLIFAGHKNLYANFGIGGFICNSDYPLKPVLSGGTGSDSLNLDMPSKYPDGFEFASPNILSIASLHAGLSWINNVTVETIAQHKTKLMQMLIDGFSSKGVQLYLPSERVKHTSVLSFNIPGYTADEIGMILNEDFDIAVRTGYHCAPFVHTFLDTLDYKGTIRVSPSFFNTENDVLAIVAAVNDIMED